MTEVDIQSSNPSILVTGGTGYIGSHAVVVLIAAGYNPIIVDNLSNSKASVLVRIAKITKKKPPFYKGLGRGHIKRIKDSLKKKSK